ncbi:MAG: hypothetical protein KGJ55_09850 [Gammaproteobacteria bacterium]|nr:hypothetical protein [Gammaproteobacteria bacterium]
MSKSPALILILLGYALGSGPITAADRTAPASSVDAPLKCRTALVNPVSGYAECVDPANAPVPPPPPRPRQPCPHDLHAMLPPAEVGCPPSDPENRMPPRR